MEIVEKAYGKINLNLDVLSRRPDGYHEVETVMQSLELADIVTMCRTGDKLTLEVSSCEIPAGPENLAWKAADLMSKTFSLGGGLKIHLEKQIPVAAGLAGGSADAAAVIRGINRLWNLELSWDRMAELAALLGSDIPFCIRGGTALAQGRGEKLTVLPPCPEFWLVLVKPPIGVSTAQVYAGLNLEKISQRPDTARLLRNISDGDRRGVAASMGNVLEEVTMKLVPEVGEIKRSLGKAGAIHAMMSGSGPTVFGLADSENQAALLAKVFEGTGYTRIITKTLHSPKGALD